ncbi:MAG: nucleotidyltransferase family protein [Planctomycetota bacterium]
MVAIKITGDALWARMERAVDRVEDRLRRAVAALEEAGVPYAVVGGLAVRVWVAQVDEAAARTTRDVDVLIRRNDLDTIKQAMQRVGFIYREVAGICLFLDGPEAKPRDAVHLVFSEEMVREDDPEPNPSVERYTMVGDLRTIDLETLVRMKLNAYRLKDRVHVLDMLEVGLIDATWVGRLPAVFAQRLQSLIDNPDG